MILTTKQACTLVELFKHAEKTDMHITTVECEPRTWVYYNSNSGRLKVVEYETTPRALHPRPSEHHVEKFDDLGGLMQAYDIRLQEIPVGPTPSP